MWISPYANSAVTGTVEQISTSAAPIWRLLGNPGYLQSHSALGLGPSSAASNLALQRSSSTTVVHLIRPEADLQKCTAHVLPAFDAGEKLHHFQFALRAYMTVTCAAATRFKGAKKEGTCTETAALQHWSDAQDKHVLQVHLTRS